MEKKRKERKKEKRKKKNVWKNVSESKTYMVHLGGSHCTKMPVVAHVSLKARGPCNSTNNNTENSQPFEENMMVEEKKKNMVVSPRTHHFRAQNAFDQSDDLR